MCLGPSHDFDDGKTAPPRRGLWTARLGWFAGLWSASVLTLAAVAFLLRAWIG